MRILLTGGAGFIGNALAFRLADEGHEVVVVDNVNSYYDPVLKEARLARLPETVLVRRIDISDYDRLARIFTDDGPFDAVAHLAAQAGVRYSLTHPLVYAQSNYLGTQNIFECAQKHNVPHVVFASSSSVYGNNNELPYTEDMRTDEPLSVYAASKRACELLGYTYHSLYPRMTITALRFFTVYGPWGRPDMAFFSFTKAILEGTPIELFNNGNMRRDFTYVDDIVDGFVRAIERPHGYRIYNLGCGKPVELTDFVACIERAVGKQAITEMRPMQPGDVPETFADITKAKCELGFEPKTNIEEGIRNFVAWYREYYGECVVVGRG